MNKKLSQIGVCHFHLFVPECFGEHTRRSLSCLHSNPVYVGNAGASVWPRWRVRLWAFRFYS